MKVEDANQLWQSTPSHKPLAEGTHYSVPIQIEYEEDWREQSLEHRSPADQERVSNNSPHPLANDYPLERDGASTLTWETFMDTVAFPEKSLPKAMEMNRDWTSAEVRDALLETLEDTVLCGTLSRHGMFHEEKPPRAMMDDILAEEEDST